jgi:hypothetical protein
MVVESLTNTLTMTLANLVATYPQSYIQPNGFFIAWNGVPVLGYDGFSKAIWSLKAELNKSIPKLRTENAGSKWAGTTLGALLDNKVLSLAELQHLKEICLSFEPLFQQISPILVTELAYVLFENRSLEKYLLNVALPLKSTIDSSPIPQSHLQETRLIHAQFEKDNLPHYLPMVQRAGNRESHYKETHIESTLVIWIKEPPIVQDFIAAVNRELPNTFAWFNPESRHITVRALLFEG